MGNKWISNRMDNPRKMEHPIKEYKKSIREQWKGLNILWDAIQMLTGKDADSIFNPSDYNLGGGGGGS